MGPGGIQGDTRYTLQCSGSYNNPLALEHGLRPGPRIHVHIWQNTSCPAVTLPKVWSAQSKPELPKTGSVKTCTTPVCQYRVQAVSSSFPSSLWDSCCLLESVCACPCVLCLSLPVSHLSPCTGVPLFGLPLPFPQSLSFISHLPVPSLSLSLPVLSITSFNSPSLFLSNFSCFCHLSVLSYVSACFPLLFSFSESLHLYFAVSHQILFLISVFSF